MPRSERIYVVSSVRACACNAPAGAAVSVGLPAFVLLTDPPSQRSGGPAGWGPAAHPLPSGQRGRGHVKSWV